MPPQFYDTFFLSTCDKFYALGFFMVVKMSMCENYVVKKGISTHNKRGSPFSFLSILSIFFVTIVLVIFFMCIHFYIFEEHVFASKLYIVHFPPPFFRFFCLFVKIIFVKKASPPKVL